MLQKNKNPFQTELENTQKTIDQKLHFSKNTCKSLILLFENLASIEEQYSKSLKQLLQSGSGAFKISLTKSKENDIGAIKSIIDVFLSGMLQVSEHHSQFKDVIRNTTIFNIKELLGSLREVKKQCLSEIDVNIKKNHEKLLDRIKSEQNSLHNPDKKLNNLFKKTPSEDIESQKQKNAVILQNLEVHKKELEDFETNAKQRNNSRIFSLTTFKELLGVVYKAESIDVFRANQTKSILIDHTSHLMKVTKMDNDLAIQLFKSYETNTLQIEYDDLSKAKSLIDPNNSLNFQNKQLPSFYLKNAGTGTGSGGDTSSSNPSSLNSLPKSETSPLSNIATPNNGAAKSLRVININKNPSPVLETQKSLPDFSAFVSRNSMYINNQPEIYPEFAYNKSLFIEIGPYQADLLTKFDLKYFNSIIYLLLSTYIKLEYYAKKDTSKEDLALMILKNKMRLSLREVKLLDKVFKVQLKNKLFYQHAENTVGRKNQSILQVILASLNKFINKKESKIRDTLAKKEDYDYFLNIIKHLLVIISENTLWEKDAKVKLNFELSDEQSDAARMKNYQQVVAFFFKDKPSDYHNYNLHNELTPVLQNQIFQNPNLNISFPINAQISEAILMSLLDTTEDNKLFIDGWEQNYEIYLCFMKDCLGLGDELASLLLLENAFNRYIKPNLVLKEKDVQEYLVAITDILGSLLFKIQNSEFESPTYAAGRGLQAILDSTSDDQFNIQINKFVNYNLSRDIWINCIRLLENLKKLIPPDTNIISGLMKIAYCSFFYQKDNLKTKDFVESIAKALETSGSRISSDFQLKRKRNQTGRSSHTQVMEYTVILDELEKEIKNAMDSYLNIIIRSLENIMKKPKETFEKKLIELFVKGCLDELITDLGKNLALDQDNAELEEDMIVIANQLGNIDTMLQQAGLSNANYADTCSVALEKWFMEYTKRARHFASQIMRKEAWQVSEDSKEITNTNIPVDLCYILFNPIEVFKKMAEGSFKDKAIKKFEVTVFEVLSQYLEHLDQSLDPILNNQTPLVWKKVSSSLGKRKPVKVNLNEIDELDSRQHLDALRIGVSKLCLRLLNLDFIQREIESSFSSVFGEKSSLIQSLRDFLATFLKRLAKKISKILVMNQFRHHFFRFLYLNIDENLLGTKSTADFRDDYDYSAHNLLHKLVPIMKLLKANVPQYYLPKLLVELLEPFLNEYLMLIVDPEKAPRTFHDNYERFLKAELDNMMEFFFPVNSDFLLNQTITAGQVSEKFTLIYKIASFFKMDTQKLIHELNQLNPLAESDYLKYKAIPRILSLRINDNTATHFLKGYKEALH